MDTNSSPLTVAAIFTAVTVPLLGLMVWLVRHTLTVTVPDILARHTLDLEAVKKTFTEELRESRIMYREELKTLRETFLAQNLQIVAELHRLGDILTEHDAHLQVLLSRAGIKNRVVRADHDADGEGKKP